MRIGSLFSGAGGLDMAVEEAFGGATVWHCENDAAASKVLAHHYPETPNHGDITTVDWSQVQPPDVLCGGFPCQDVSGAGRKEGLAGARSGLWSEFSRAIAMLKPKYVVVENVRGLETSGALRVIKDELTWKLGYDVAWNCTSAASVGACHRRRRIFIVAARAQDEPGTQYRVHGDDGAPKVLRLLPTPEAKNAHAGQDYARVDRPNSGGDDLVTAIIKAYPHWDRYADAIGRWESVTRPAPPLTEPTSTGNPRLNAAFAEWMMGWPAGWVTEVPAAQSVLFGDGESGISRSDQLKLCGNGVVPQQAVAAITALMAPFEVAA